VEEPHLAEWGLRKVLPSASDTERSKFARHVIPVILELCRASMSVEEVEELMQRCEEVLSSEEEPPPPPEGGG
jgi:hypothetical protein